MPNPRRQRQSGRMRVRAEVYQTIPTYNDDGQEVEADLLLYSRWLGVKPMRGNEQVLDDQQQADYTHTVELWRDSQTKTLTPKNWFKLADGTRYDIVRIFDPNMDGAKLEAEVKQRDS